MTNVLLTKDYKSKSAGTLLTDVSVREAKAISVLGLGETLADPVEEKGAKKADKVVE